MLILHKNTHVLVYFITELHVCLNCAATTTSAALSRTHLSVYRQFRETVDFKIQKEEATERNATKILAADLDLAFQLQLAEVIEASPESSDAAYALALHAADLARAAHDRSASSLRVAAHDALFARELAAVPENRWADHGDDIERPLALDSSSPRQLFRVLFKGMASKEVVGPRDRDPGVAVLAAAVCGPEGEVLLRVQKAVEEEGFVGGREVLEAMALIEGLNAALGLGIRDVEPGCHNHIMVERIREGQIPPTQKIYCPYPKCSALMSLSELVQPLQQSSSKYTATDAATLRKCVRCRGSFCITCKVPWHDRMTCYQYKRRHPHARPEDAKLQNLARQRLWRQCVKCNHMIELAEGCYHMTCVCGYEFCYTCGKKWKEKKATCTCPLWEERNIIRHDENGAVYPVYLDEEEEDYYDEEDDGDGPYVEEGNMLYNQVYWRYDDRAVNYHRYNN